MRVKIFPKTVEQIRNIAEARVQGHMSRGSRTGPENTEQRILQETRATICEFAFSLAHPALRGMFDDSTDCKGDGGFDYQLVSGRRIDVKSGPPFAKTMVVSDKSIKRCDTFVMTRYLERERYVEFIGWLNSVDVPIVGERGHIKQWKGRPHWIVDLEHLKNMEELKIA